MSDKKKRNGKPAADIYPNFLDSTQTFGAIGLLEAVQGDVILRGRHGERDHLYPLPKAIAWSRNADTMTLSMLKHGVKGWDTMKDISDDLRAKILEAINQRRALGRPIPPAAIRFEQLGGHWDLSSGTDSKA